MDTTLTATPAAGCPARTVMPPITGAEGTAMSGVRTRAVGGLVPAAATGPVAGPVGGTAPAYTSAPRLVTDSYTDATQVLPRGRPV